MVYGSMQLRVADDIVSLVDCRLLNQFSFNLSPDWELPSKLAPSQEPLREGVRDMLVKHHLFSWDL